MSCVRFSAAPGGVHDFARSERDGGVSGGGDAHPARASGTQEWRESGVQLQFGSRARMSEEDAFVAAILAAPHDDTARLVFADWLEDHSDPRAGCLRLAAR